MILYNTLMGVAAGAAMIMLAMLARSVGSRRTVAPAGWASAFLALGLLLTVVSTIFVVTWPIKAKPQANILFGEPTLFLGVLLLAAGLLLWIKSEDFAHIDTDEQYARVVRLVTPLAWLSACLGVVLLSCAASIFVFSAIGTAPPQEPISGGLPAGVENAFVGGMYVVAGLGAILAPFAIRNLKGSLAQVMFWCFTVGGALVLAYSAMNYYTHVGDIMRSG